MTLDQHVQALLDAGDPDAQGFESMTLEQVREAVAGMQQVCGPGLRVAEVRDLDLPGPDGDALQARLYHPSPGRELPLLVLLFGGGFVAGSIDVIDSPARQLAVLGELAVLSVDYRLAPEHPFPAALQDAITAVRWASAHAGELGADAARIGIAGESSGGGLAAGTALALRGELDPPLAAQVLIYPVLDADLRTPSYEAHADGPLLTRAAMHRFLTDYLGDTLTDPPAGATPGRAQDLTGLPATLLTASEHDPLRSEAEQYAARLHAAGVSTDFRLWAGMSHASWYFDQVSPVAAALNQDLARASGRLLHEASPSAGSEAPGRTLVD